MTDLSALTKPNGSVTAPITGPVEAVIATTPTTLGEEVMVLIGGARQQTGPCRWMPRNGVFPARGDPCVIDETATGHRFVAWWASATGLDAAGFGGVFDGRGHPLSDGYATLSAAQAVYPFVTALSQQVDWAALTKAIGAARPNAATPPHHTGLVRVQGLPYFSDVVAVPGGVIVDGGSSGATICTGPAGFAGPFFDLSLHDGIGHLEFSGQGWRPGLKNVTVRPNTMPTAASLNVGTTDTRQVVDGVHAHAADGFILDNVVVEMIAGYHFKIGAGAREASITDCRSWRGGYEPDDKAAVIFENDSGDPNNLIDLSGLHIGYAAYVGLDFSETGDLAAQGSRMVNFIGGQIEGGGYGDAGNPLKTSNDMPPYDLIRVSSGRDIKWSGTEIGGGTQAGKALVKLIGNATTWLGTMEFDSCSINNVGAGVSFDCEKAGAVSVLGGTLFANTGAGAKHLKTMALDDPVTPTTGTILVRWFPAVQNPGGETGLDVADWSRVQRDELHWVALTPLNGWSNHGSYQAARVSKDRFGVVRVEGTIMGGTTAFGTALVTLPNGMRPTAARKFVVEANATVGTVSVQTDGNILILSGTNAAFSLDGIEFAV